MCYIKQELILKGKNMLILRPNYLDNFGVTTTDSKIMVSVSDPRNDKQTQIQLVISSIPNIFYEDDIISIGVSIDDEIKELAQILVNLNTYYLFTEGFVVFTPKDTNSQISFVKKENDLSEVIKTLNLNNVKEFYDLVLNLSEAFPIKFNRLSSNELDNLSISGKNLGLIGSLNYKLLSCEKNFNLLNIMYNELIEKLEYNTKFYEELLKDLRNNINRCEIDKSEMVDEFTTLDNKANKEIEKLQKEVENLTNTINQLNNTNAQLNVNNSELVEQTTKYRNQALLFKLRYDNSEIELLRMYEKLDEMGVYYDKLSKGYEKSLKENFDEIGQLRATKLSLTEENKTLNREKSSVDYHYQRALEEKVSLNERIDSRNVEISTLVKDLRKSEDRVVLINKELDELKAKCLEIKHH